MSQPFARALAMMALIRAAMGEQNPQLAMANIGPYVSRGKNKTRGFVKSWLSASAYSKRGKYIPHQGDKECARRLAKQAA